MNDDLLARLLQKVEHRFYGKYRGIVVNNADPDKRGRLQLKIPSVLGNDVVSGWALPCAPYGGATNEGIFFIPDKDAGVWVEFEAGLLEYPIWVGTFWTLAGEAGSASEAPEPANIQLPPTSKIIKTKNHTIELEDADGKEKIVIKHKGNSFVTIDKDGSVLVGNQKGSLLVLDAKNEHAVLLEQHGNVITMDETGIVITQQAAQAMVQLTDDAVHVAAKSVILDGAAVSCGAGAQEPTILGQTFAAMWNAFLLHTHATAGLGPPVPPTPIPIVQPLAPGKGLTTAVTVK